MEAITSKTPLLFAGHGNPMNAISENSFVKGFREIRNAIPQPKSILCISAHWFTKGTQVTHMPIPETIHDFGGFPQALYEVQYPAEGNPALAEEIKELLHPANVILDEAWGLDHGTWTVLTHLFPKANVPVVQLSIDFTKDPEFHYQLATALSPLREKGILIIGSGNIIHNLRRVDFENLDKSDYGYDWAVEAREIINQLIITGDVERLLDYRNLPKVVQLAIPSPDHFLPLIYILGLKQDEEKITFFNDVLVAGSLSMTSLLIN
jgi:4,5-DOPA dioxygenase extradiol